MVATTPTAAKATKVAWAPNSRPQVRFLACPVYEMLVEGNRGGGKTDLLLMDFAQHVGQGYGDAWQGVLFRREYKDLDDVVKKSKRWFRQIFPEARFLESKADYKWVWPAGEELRFRTAKREDDYWGFHGQEIPWIAWEELTEWASPGLYLAMMSCCRSSVHGIPRKYRANCNPYGPGHSWVKARFIDAAPEGSLIRNDDAKSLRTWLHVDRTDNVHLQAADPDYESRIMNVRDPARRAAWVKGTWDIVAGGMFDDVWDREAHVLPPFDIPDSWYVDRCFDWGSSKPFAVLWTAEADGADAAMADGTIRSFPPGTLFVAAEWYGWNGEPNEGCRMIDTEIARGILEREGELGMGLAGRVSPGPADTSIFDETNADSTAAKMERMGVRWDRADKSPGSRANGWQVVRRRLAASLETPMEEPGLFVFDTCRQTIRTVPVLPRDTRKPDDVDTETEDHIADALRYRATHQRAYSEVVDMRL